MDRDKNNDPDQTPDNERDLPGYPHYPPDEDIMNPQSGFKKISADEEVTTSRDLTTRTLKGRLDEDVTNLRNDEDDLKIVRGTEADVTPEDIELLGSREGDLDDGDDELVRGSARVDDIDNEEEDLDVPGADLDDENEELGEEDEENNYYSLGGDRHENLEEDQA